MEIAIDQPAATPSARAHPVPVPLLSIAIGGALLVGAWLATGVRITELVLFLLYELVVVLGPGLVLQRLLSGQANPDGLERLTIGYALGAGLHVAVFTLTAAAGSRGLLPFYPVVFYGVAIGMIATGRWERPRLLAERERRVAIGPLAVVALVAASVVVGFYISNPLPRTVNSVAYDQDLVYHLALDAEAKTQWPIDDPNIAGDPLHYHTFANRDMAGISEATGIPLDVLLMRLWPAIVLLVIGAQLFVVTRRLGGSAGAGLLAAVLGLLGGEVEFDTTGRSPLSGGSILTRIASPGFLFGAIFFLAAICIVLDMQRSRRPEWRHALVLGLLLFAAAGAKASASPVFVGGLVLYGALALLLRRRVPAWLWPAGIVSVGTWAIAYVLMYRGAGASRGFDLKPLHYGQALAPSLPDWLAAVLEVVVLLAMLAPLIGIVALAVINGRRWPDGQVVVACMVPPGIGAFLALTQPGGAEVYFLGYSAFALVPLAALGVAGCWSRLGLSDRGNRLLIAAGFVFALCIAAVGALFLGSKTAPPATTNMIVSGVAFLVIVAVSVVVAVWRFPDVPKRIAVVGLMAPLILVLGVLDYPVDSGSRLVSRWSKDEPAWQESAPGKEAGMTSGLHQGLLWIKDHTPKSSVLAVNNPFIGPGGFARYFYYAAWAERPTYAGGWEYAEQAAPIFKGQPLSNEILTKAHQSWAASVGTPAAITALAQDGVDYLVVDKKNAQFGDPAKVAQIVKPSFENADVAIYRIGDGSPGPR